ncbi:MAG: DUF3108 domain-containing protein [Methylophilaceae bacterium]|nr:DUF3108 domain-containing protein [Methylophilaceae bacterium]
MKKTIEFLQSLFSKNKTLILSLIVSLFAHLFLLSKFTISLPEIEESQQVLTVNLRATQKAALMSANNVAEESTVTSKPSQPELSAANTNDTNTISDELQIQQKNPAETVLLPVPQNTQLVEHAITNPVATNTVAIKQTSDKSESIETASVAHPSPQAYKYVETEFEVRYSNDASSVGIARMVFNIDKNHTYMLTSMTNAKGLASPTVGTLIQKSEGVVNEKGLTPSYFSSQYGIYKDKVQSARFAWSEGILQIHNSTGDKNEKLTEGTQDLLSFMYQFMFFPPRGNIQVPMINTKNLHTYIYIFQGVELISTKLGELKTIHLQESEDGEEKNELWLAMDYQYLPVKIRKTEKDKSFVEQTVTTIYTISP